MTLIHRMLTIVTKYHRSIVAFVQVTKVDDSGLGMIVDGLIGEGERDQKNRSFFRCNSVAFCTYLDAKP